MTVHQKITDLIPAEPRPIAPQETSTHKAPSPPWTPFKIAVVAGLFLLLWQLSMPVKYTPGGIIGKILVSIEKQKDMAEAEIQALREHLKVSRTKYAETLTQYQSLAAKCSFTIVIGAEWEQLCRGTLDMNFQPQLKSLQAEITRLQTELRTLESAL